jgi:hypothetical protein
VQDDDEVDSDEIELRAEETLDNVFDQHLEAKEKEEVKV